MKHTLLTLSLGAVLFCNPKAQAAQLAQLETFGTVGKQLTPLSKDKEAELFSYQGKGCLTHMWFGGDFKNSAYWRRNLT